MLYEEELVASIKDKIPDFSIHMSDLKAPTAKFVQSYYVRVLEEVGGWTWKNCKSHRQKTCVSWTIWRHIRRVLPLAKLHAALYFVFKYLHE